MEALETADAIVMSAANVTEALIVGYGYDCEPQMKALIEQFGIEIEPVTPSRAAAAARAYRRYGKRWHAASLNYGDSFAYSLAMEKNCPLLFIGRDFSLTNIDSVLECTYLPD